ncbi:MAG: hypothetical protein Q4C58_14760 [Eubacteriales bacterium]|nr:hypothetical protein [Eubacteriales bacterium]
MRLQNFKVLDKGRKMSRIGSLIGAVVLVIFCIYGLVYQYFDTVVVLGMILGIVSSELYICLKGKAAQCLNVVSVLCSSFSLGLFFLNSYPVWADRVNHISMYSSRGTLFPVITIMALSIAGIICEIISCFICVEKEEA